MALLALILYGVFSVYNLWKNSFKVLHTNDAFLNGPTLIISSEIPGKISEVFVQLHAHVKKNELLAKIEEDNYRQMMIEAENEMLALKDLVDLAQITFIRISNLRKSGLVSAEQYDKSHAEYLEFKRKLNAAKAEYRRSQLALSQTEIRAPEEGSIARQSVHQGALVAPGVPMFAYTIDRVRWIEAAFKETQLNQIKVGMLVEIKIDASPFSVWHGEVESIGSATGSTFSLLPPNNATGNFTPVVQRIPVRIRIIDIKKDNIENLPVGLSAEVKIQVRK